MEEERREATPTADRALVAGREALGRGAWPEARAAFTEALAHGESPAGLEGLSWATWWLEDVAGCLDARERAYRAYRREHDQRGAARMALWLGDDHLSFRGAQAVADGWFRRAARLLDALPTCPEHGWAAVFAAHSELARGDPTAARRLTAEAQEIGRRHGAVDLEMFALATEGAARIAQGDVVAGLGCLDEATAAALGGEYENLAPAAWSCCLLLSACEQVRDYERGAQWCVQVAAFSRRMDARFLRGVCRAHYGAIQGWHGGWEEAERELLTALDDLTAARSSWRSDAVVRLAELRRQQGRLDEAAGLFAQAPEHPLAQRGAAALRLDRGEPKAARDLLERILRKVPRGYSAWRADVLELLVRADVALGDGEAATARLAELRSAAEGVPTEPLQAAVSASAGVVATAAGDLEQACDHFEDAVDGFTRSGAPLHASRARIELARALLALGRVPAAEEEVQTARARLAELGAVVDSVRADELVAEVAARSGVDAGVEGPLTARQLEVLRLVADGCTDQVIAAQLVISEHTVHRHIANIYTRLDCSSRAAAVAHASRLGLL